MFKNEGNSKRLAVKTSATGWWWWCSRVYVVVYSGWEVTHASYVRLIKRKSIGPDPSLGVSIGPYQPQQLILGIRGLGLYIDIDISKFSTHL
jgi:hypothetical protein